MIVDTLANAHLYYGLGPRIELALRALQGDLTAKPEGKHALQGDAVFGIVQSYTTKPESACKWEAHRKYIDVQYVIEGTESIAVAPQSEMTGITHPYDAEKDYELYTGAGTAWPMKPGMFMLLFPHDAHMPQLARGTPGLIRKVVVKVAV